MRALPERRRGPGRGRDGGSVTVELAIGFVAVVTMIALILVVAQTSLTRHRLCHAAREGARAYSLGAPDSASVADKALGVLAERGGAVHLSRSERWVTATATAPGVAIGSFTAGSASCTVQTLMESTAP
ncbi:TadE/TadG family type IV pilus assembly protein [Actinomyces mediterranea]|uniref:TadE/TadG family type IV pilus assembly protein n=1 Tax=Actinomyces mediterranea TaxID=1871028 RepID=UPI0009703A48|nr:TadE/TadG family type IV pilus assembly protein [Actinomyces mediterranea]